MSVAQTTNLLSPHEKNPYVHSFRWTKWKLRERERERERERG